MWARTGRGDQPWHAVKGNTGHTYCGKPTPAGPQSFVEPADNRCLSCMAALERRRRARIGAPPLGPL